MSGAGVEIVGPLLGLALTLGVIGWRFGRVGALAGAGLGFALGFLPVNATDTLASFALGVLGPASASFLAWVVLAALKLATGTAPKGSVVLAGLFVALAVALYPSAMGTMPYDLYREGFAGIALPLALGVLVVLSVWRGWTALGVWFGCLAAVLAFRLHPSANLFDAMIDVPSVVIAIGVLVAGALARRG